MKLAPFLILFALIATLLSGQPKPAKPDFSGDWLLSGQSGESRHATDTPLMHVDHREPQLELSFAATPSRQPDIWALTTDGAENTSRNGRDVKSRTWWQEDRLIAEWTTEAGGNPLHHRQVWCLSGNGKILTLAMRDGDVETSVTAQRQSI